MSTETPNARAIFIEAVENVATEQWSEFLDERCGDDQALRARVERLLDAQGDIGSFMLKPAAAAIATLEHDPLEKPGTQIGPYKLLQQIGEGGMGTVYMAEQTQPVRRKVALKVIKPGMDSRQVIARFEAERQALAIMDHVNIARVLDAGTTEQGRPYFVMELVHGLSITKYCDGNRLSPRQRLELFVPVCQAIQHAHQKGIIHRDIKPSNVMITLYDGKPVPKVIDFGVARATESTAGRLTERTLFTQYGAMVGTPEYMSPEQAEMSALGVDTRSDIYSLGVLMYELLTGGTPLTRQRVKTAAHAEILRMIKEEEPPKPSTRLSTTEELPSIAANRGLDPKKLSGLMRGELDWIVMKSLEKDRNRRYETASAFAADVQRYLNDETVEACPPSTAYRLRKFVRRNHAALTTASLIAAALLIGIVVSTWQAIRATEAEGQANNLRELAEGSAKEAQHRTTEAVKAQEAALHAQEAAQHAEREAKRQRNEVSQNLYFADMRLGLVDWRSGNTARLSEKLLGHVPQRDADDLRGWEWYYLLALCHQEEVTFMQHCGQVDSIAWSPDRHYLASTGSDGAVAVYDSTTWQVRHTWIGEHVFSGAWSPDSRRFAWTRQDGGCHIAEVETGKKTRLRGDHFGGQVAWSRDGKYLACSYANGIRIWTTETSTTVDVLPGSEIVSLTWDPQGKLLALLRNGEELKTWHPDSGESLTTLIRKDWESAAWSPDTSQLALGLWSGTCQIYNTADWSLAREWQAHAGTVNAVAWRADARQLATAGAADRLTHVWDTVTSQNLATIRGHLNQVISLAWEPNGRRLASGSIDSLVKVWPLPPAEQPHRVDAHAGAVAAIKWSRDGQTLTSLGATDGKMTHWNVVDGQPISNVSVPVGSSASFSGDVKRLAVTMVYANEIVSQIRDADSGELVQTVKQGTVRGWPSALSSDASKLAVTDYWGNTVEIFDLRSGEVHFRYSGQSFLGLAWSCDGRFLAVAGKGDLNVQHGNERWSAFVHVFDVEKRQRILKLRHGRHWVPASAVSFSQDGQRLVSGGVNGLIEVWALPEGHKTASAQLHTGQILALDWFPDGGRVASASLDGTIRVWDPVHGEELLKLDVPSSYVTHLAWSPDGQRLAAATAEGTILLWDASSGHRYAHSETFYFEQIHEQLRDATRLWYAGQKKESLARCAQILEENKPKLGSFPPWVGKDIPLDAKYSTATTPSEQDIALAQTRVALSNQDRHSLHDLANLLSRSGRLDEAIATYRECIRLNNENHDELRAPHFNLGLHLWNKWTASHDRKYLHEAIASYREALHLDEDFDEARVNLGVVLQEAGQFEEAISVNRDLIRRNRGSASVQASAHNNLACALLDCPDARLRDLNVALESAQKAVELDPNERDFWNTLGTVRYRRGEWDNAISDLEKSMQLRNGRDSGDWFFLAMAHWQLGHKEEAQTWFQKAVDWMDKTKPEDEGLRRFRKEAEDLMGVKGKPE